MADRPTRERVEDIRRRAAAGEDDVGDLECRDLLAEIDALRSDLATARRDALNGAAEACEEEAARHRLTADTATTDLLADCYAEHARKAEARASWLRDRARAEEGK